MSARFLRRLPAELELMIIEQIPFSKDALCAASLVCSAWYELAQTRLYRRVALYEDSGADNVSLKSSGYDFI